MEVFTGSIQEHMPLPNTTAKRHTARKQVQRCDSQYTKKIKLIIKN